MVWEILFLTGSHKMHLRVHYRPSRLTKSILFSISWLVDPWLTPVSKVCWERGNKVLISPSLILRWTDFFANKDLVLYCTFWELSHFLRFPHLVPMLAPSKLQQGWNNAVDWYFFFTRMTNLFLDSLPGSNVWQLGEHFNWNESGGDKHRLRPANRCLLDRNCHQARWYD